MKKLYQHAGTGRFEWAEGYPGTRYYLYPTMHEDELPPMTDAEYNLWHFNSQIVDGVRVGPHVGEYVNPKDLEKAIQEVMETHKDVLEGLKDR